MDYLSLERFETPTGRMLMLTDASKRLRALDWEDHEGRMLKLLARQYGGNRGRLCEVSNISDARRALLAYFEGALDAIDSLPTETNGTPFQRAVWKALRAIQSGRPISYGQLAARIGRPSAIRAVGLANGSNPIAIVVPCHRVIGADLSLTGYGGGLDRKRWLLVHEGADILLRGQKELAL